MTMIHLTMNQVRRAAKGDEIWRILPTTKQHSHGGFKSCRKQGHQGSENTS